MPISNLNKTWIPGSSRGTTTFNAPGTLTIPYGRYLGTLSGVGGLGTANTAATYNTNYNVAYPVGTRPIGTQPAATWNTNYNVAYPIAGFSFGGFYTIPCGTHHVQSPWSHNTQYQCRADSGDGTHGDSFVSFYIITDSQTIAFFNTNYNTAYPIGNRPAATWNTNYNTNYNTVYPIANQPAATYNLGSPGTPITLFGVTMPGGPAGGGPATPISPTTVNYWSALDNNSYPVTVPPGGQVVFKTQ